MQSAVPSAVVVVPAGSPDAIQPSIVGPVQPGVPEPVTGGGGDRLVVVTSAAATARESATLLAARQLSEEADRYPYRGRSAGALSAAGRRRVLYAVLEQRRREQRLRQREEDAAGH